MRFEDAMIAMRNGMRVQRKDWKNTKYQMKHALCDERDNIQEGYLFSADDVMAEDWLVVPEAVKVTCEDDGA